jgi:hypothetical protein
MLLGADITENSALILLSNQTSENRSNVQDFAVMPPPAFPDIPQRAAAPLMDC